MEVERESVPFNASGNSGGGRSDTMACTVIPVKLQVALWISCFLMALVAVIISVVSLTGTSVNVNVSPGAAGSSAINDEKIWMFAIHHSGLNLEYTDDASGEVRGFNVDLVNAVCRIANKNCRLVVDYYKRCWNRVPGEETAQGGLGLFGRYYDACIGWHHTHERARVFQFSDPWAQKKPGAFYVKPTNPKNFNWLNLAGRTIGFINGMAFDEHCIARVKEIKGNVLNENQIKLFTSRDDLISAILNDTIDAGFDIDAGYQANEDVEQASDDITACVVAGMAMMALKDSQLPLWWNPALKKLMNSYEYRVVCDDLKEKHGHWPGPTPAEFCIGY